MSLRMSLTIAGIAVIAAASALTQAAVAQDRYVTAESRYGTATITGPVRRVAANRYEVRLPGGTWIDCHRSCSEALRRETIDFWQNHDGRNGSPGDGPGYLLWKW